MTYQLFLGDRTFSSWSLRGWLAFKKFDIPVKVTMLGLYSGTFKQDLAQVAPARTVPVVRTPEGEVVGDSLAIAETLAERHPDAGIWPRDPAARTRARWLAAEMHSSFGALRSACAMNLTSGLEGFEVADDVRADLDRIDYIWADARKRFGGDGPWLCGTYSMADVFYAPVAARIAAYGLPVSDDARAYVDAHLADTAFRQWRAMGLTKTYDPMPYETGLPRLPWPGPAPIPARAVDDGADSVNDTCPYSGDPVTDFLEAGGRVYGFCNPFCRDKTVNDPAAWPAFMDIYQS